jgi:hypothetical protein
MSKFIIKKNWRCTLFGHIMYTPFINSRPTNMCIRCHWTNKKYNKEGYYAKR